MKQLIYLLVFCSALSASAQSDTIRVKLKGSLYATDTTKLPRTATTSDIAEGTNLYFTQTRVRTTPLTGYTVGSNAIVEATDDFLTAFGKVQAQINARQAQLNGSGFVKASGTTITYDNTTYEAAFSKNTAFNKNFGTTAGTVAEGNDSRIVNGQTAYGWGNHASAGYLTSIADGTITNTKLATMPAGTFKGNNTGSTAAPADLTVAQVRTSLSIDNVENTALSTWAGSSNITTLGTIATGTWNGSTISVSKGGTGLTALGTGNQLLRVNSGATALEYFTPDYATNTDMTAALDLKVDKVEGMGLSEVNFTAEKDSKLQGIQNGATANQTDAYLLNRQNHTQYLPYSAFDPAMFEELDVNALNTPYTSVAKLFGSPTVYQTVRTEHWEATTTHTAVDGQAIAQAIYIPRKDTLTGIKIHVTNNATFTANNNNKVFLFKYNTDGTVTKVAESANSGSIFSSAGIKTVAFAAGSYIADPGLYYVGFLWNNDEAVTPSPTAPTIRAATATAAEGSTFDFPNGAKLSWQINSLTDIGTTYTLSTLTATGVRTWQGLYK